MYAGHEDDRRPDPAELDGPELLALHARTDPDWARALVRETRRAAQVDPWEGVA